MNLLSRVWLSHRVLPDMKKSQFGRIVLVSSSSAFQPLPGMTSYSSSNVGLLFFGEGLSYEVKGNGIRVLTVCPGGMQTNFQQSAGVKEVENEKLMLPKEVVEEVMLKISGSNPVVSVPLRSKGMALAARFMPRRLNLLLWGWLMKKAR